jgi:hypothetical protein
MKKKRFGVEQIAGVLKQAEVGVPGGGTDSKSGHQRTDLLPMEGEVCWP